MPPALGSSFKKVSLASGEPVSYLARKCCRGPERVYNPADPIAGPVTPFRPMGRHVECY